MSLRKVKDNPSLYRDEYSKAIVNTDNKGYQDYMINRNRLKSQQESALNNSREIENHTYLKIIFPRLPIKT